MHNCCRFCGLQNNENFVNLFNNKIPFEKQNSPAEMINLIFKEIQINENDELSKQICSQCLNSTLQCFNFYNLIKNSLNELKMILKQKKLQKKNQFILPDSEILENPDVSQPDSNEKRIYDCYECPKKYRAPRQLKKHQSECHCPDVNLCNFCNIWFDQNINLQQHIVNQHQDSKYKCFQCKSEKFMSQRRLFNHFKHKHSFEFGLFKCEKCQIELDSRNSLDHHITKNHLKSMVFNNKFTGEISVKEEKVEDDSEQRNDNKEYNRNNRNETEIYNNKLDEVMDVEFLDEFFLNQNSENSFEFNECWDALELCFEDDLKIKMSDLANEMLPQLHGVHQYQCPHCKKGFVRQIEVLIHLAHDHNMSVLSCDTCSENFSNLNDVKMHKIQHLGKNVVKTIEENQMEIIRKLDQIIYRCKFCRRKYKEKNNFVLHECKKQPTKIEFDKITTFICDLCGEEFSHLKSMYLHKRNQHLNCLKCKQCNKTFKSSLGFKYHLKSHIGVKSLQCPFCDRNFLSKMNLNAHIKAIHSIVKNHLCTLCDRNFATLDHLKKHVMSVHQKERSHLCSICGKLFSQVSHLKFHFKIHDTNLEPSL